MGFGVEIKFTFNLKAEELMQENKVFAMYFLLFLNIRYGSSSILLPKLMWKK